MRPYLLRRAKRKLTRRYRRSNCHIRIEIKALLRMVARISRLNPCTSRKNDPILPIINNPTSP